MRPTILVDLDGPVADFDRHYWNTVVQLDHDGDYRRDRRDPLFDIFSLDDQRHRFLSSHVQIKRLRDDVRKIVDSAGWFASLPPTDGGPDGVRELAEHADVWICSKPLAANPTGRDEKAAWLVEHVGPGWDERLILAPDKSMIRGDVLLDDAIKPAWLASASWIPVVFDAPFNGPGTKHGSHWLRFSWTQGVESLLRVAYRK